MSEHQIVAFRAIDGRVSDKNLEYMEQQSSRAEITPHSFDNEYHYSDFRGNAKEMLRRGYDIHLHYANFGTRTLMIRLPQGLPDLKAADPYLSSEGIELIEDKNGPGVILEISPCYEPDDLEQLYDIDELIGRLIPLRAEILNGDLRPFYLAQLGIAQDMNHDPEEEIEGPVPAGLTKLTPAQEALAELYGLDAAFIKAAALKGPALSSSNQVGPDFLTWIKVQPEAQKNQWLAEWLEDPATNVRSELLNQFRSQSNLPAWPTTIVGRKVSDIESVAEELREQAKTKAAAAVAKQAAERMAKIAANPDSFLKQTESILASQAVNRFRDISAILVEVRDVLAATGRANLATEQAAKLVHDHPTQTKLLGEFRRQGLIPKYRAAKAKAKGK